MVLAQTIKNATLIDHLSNALFNSITITPSLQSENVQKFNSIQGCPESPGKHWDVHLDKIDWWLCFLQDFQNKKNQTVINKLKGVQRWNIAQAPQACLGKKFGRLR